MIWLGGLNNNKISQNRFDGGEGDKTGRCVYIW